MILTAEQIKELEAIIELAMDETEGAHEGSVLASRRVAGMLPVWAMENRS